MPAKKNHHLCSRVSFVIFLLCGVHSASANSVVNTKHNLSMSGPGEIHSTSEDRVCIFCHTPHHASSVTPLWSRPLNTSVYDLYASTTMSAVPGQPTGYSRLCLSCHDGTIALGLLHGTATPIPFAGGVVTMPSSRPSNLGTDLRNDHPISFAYTSQLAELNGELKLPVDLPLEIKLEDGINLQCTSCHNPHSDPYGKFLVMDNSSSQLCVACHAKTGWVGSSHAAVEHEGVTGCLNCHDTHGAGGAVRLLKNFEEEKTCLDCHKTDGASGAVDIQTAIAQISHHPVEAAVGVHDPVEDPLTAPYHVECGDCHNPHQLDGAQAAAPLVNGRMKGVKGVTITGGVTSDYAQYEYEVCFRCHGDHSFVSANIIPRWIEEGNKRLCFDPVNPSYHPVAAPGKGVNVPSLRPEYTTSSMIYCTDCHNNNDSVKAGGTGANGPHGSDNEPLLIARYETGYPQTYSQDSYALCFRCHDQTVVLSANSPFDKHALHVMGQHMPCAVCHDPHGIPLARGGTTEANAHLINFDSAVVASGAYVSTGPNRGCTVSCHMQNPRTY